MPSIIRDVDRCRVCGHQDWLDLLSLGRTPLANNLLDPADRDRPQPEYPVDVIVCRSCRLMSLRHVVDPEVLFSDYVYVSSNSDLHTTHMHSIADWCVAKAELLPGDLVVELGSNIGSQLALFGKRGMRTVGVDPARNLAAVANADGIETIADFFGPKAAGQVQARHGRAALVLGRQCFAHIDDLHHVLDGVDAVLAEDGLLVIEVPYLLDLLQQNQFDTIYHEHLSYLSLGTFARLFAAHGLRIVDVERAPVHGGSIVVFAARETAGREPAAAVADLHAVEQAAGLAGDQPYLAFAERVGRLRREIGDLVRDLAGQGKRIAGYGTPSKGTALLRACGLGADEIAYCTDTTPGKQGRLIAGSLIPVVSPQQARREPPDYWLLLAWNYADEIISKEQAFLDAGGRFIIPIPQPRIVAAADVTSATGQAA
ncbi:class I SAM-dependent methyltransferase [Actinoplanes teichomyceticus]|uniref:Novobiocin biosynthesis protein NovU/D-mycarose 3-C-methyltransferase n=1 Tax=Actinoplanes teichomyceticus TaxID=1867 RepID=A0A561WBY7_ACTTI|nr:class I SAM-dependent methyltransferase [Actinoplanes teichomyceticus]TWG21353.1 novobiocin biosynthesis protein NovU/D-mycarose 3-C-methyltransferase [Actinoplanes teichomyceticus]GIF16438.1 methyltransferase [Actinoplanes teichomyceticus]